MTVKPGITDYATLFYNDEQTILAQAEDIEKTYVEEILPHKLQMYRAYVGNQSLCLDFRLLTATLLKMAGLSVDSLVPEMEHLKTDREEKQVPDQVV